MSPILINALRETIMMLMPACLLTILIGIPLGIGTTSKNIYRVLRPVLQISSEVQFLLIMILCAPLMNWLLAHNIKYNFAAIVPLTISGVLILAQKVNAIIYPLSHKWAATGRSLGANAQQTLWMIVLPEGLDQIMAASFYTCSLLVGFSAIAGVFGAGGLGQLAVESSFRTSQPILVLISVAILVSIQQLIKFTGSLVVSQNQP